MSARGVFERSIEVAVPVGDLYRFHLDTRNAPRISPPRARFLAIEGTFPLALGSEVRLVVRQPPLPMAQEWRIVVAELVPDRLLVDVATRSPFATWRHEHRFEPVDAGRSRLTDRVEYTLPLGPLGRVGDRLVVRRMLRSMFASRQEATRAFLESRAAAGAGR